MLYRTVLALEAIHSEVRQAWRVWGLCQSVLLGSCCVPTWLHSLTSIVVHGICQCDHLTPFSVSLLLIYTFDIYVCQPRGFVVSALSCVVSRSLEDSPRGVRLHTCDIWDRFLPCFPWQEECGREHAILGPSCSGPSSLGSRWWLHVLHAHRVVTHQQVGTVLCFSYHTAPLRGPPTHTPVSLWHSHNLLVEPELLQNDTAPAGSPTAGHSSSRGCLVWAQLQCKHLLPGQVQCPLVSHGLQAG